jgi:hypothetical protein
MENKTGKYLKYAIGEILLVIIGILIALQINNWNDKRIERKELSTALHAMVIELDNNIQFLEAEKKDKQKKLLAIQNFKDVTDSAEEKRQLVFAVSDEIKSKEFTTIYNAIKDEKKIRLIQSKELRNQITAFYEYELASVRDTNTWHKKFVSENIDPYILEYIPFVDNEELDPNAINELLSHRKFNNILKSQKRIYEGYLSVNERVTKLAFDLKSKISSHLNNQ